MHAYERSTHTHTHTFLLQKTDIDSRTTKIQHKTCCKTNVTRRDAQVVKGRELVILVVVVVVEGTPVKTAILLPSLPRPFFFLHDVHAPDTSAPQSVCIIAHSSKKPKRSQPIHQSLTHSINQKLRIDDHTNVKARHIIKKKIQNKQKRHGPKQNKTKQTEQYRTKQNKTEHKPEQTRQKNTHIHKYTTHTQQKKRKQKHAHTSVSVEAEREKKTGVEGAAGRRGLSRDPYVPTGLRYNML